MKLRTFLASTAAFGAIAVIVPATVPTSWNPVTFAEAATSISFSVFYDGLADHGDWVSYNDAYVFVPVNTRRDWRPYTDGHWVYASSYGWTWASDEPFGWATYHYGRWGFAEDIGWYWVPGTKWAPAWVSWRRTGDHVAWAPLPPSRGRGGGDSDVSVYINFDTVPDYYWNVVPTQSFLSINIETVIIQDNDRRRRIAREAEFVGNVTIENNVVVNNAIEINYIEEKSGKKVEKVELKKTDDAGSAKGGKGGVTAYTGEISAEAEAKPPKVTEIEKVKKAGDQAEGQATDAPAVDQAATPADKKNVTPEQAEGQATEAPAVDQAAQPVDKKKKVTPEQAEGQATDAPAVDQAAQPADKKKKKLTPEEAQGEATEAPATEQAAQPENKKKKLTPEQAEAAAATDDMPVGSVTKPEQKADKKQSGEEPAANKDKKAVPCDPATDSECVPQ